MQNSFDVAEAVSSGKMVSLKDMQVNYLDQLSGKSHQALFLQKQMQETLTERVKNAIVFL